MTGMEQLIDQLSTDAEIKKCGPNSRQCPWRIFALWVVLSVVYCGLVLAFYLHPRADLMVKFHEPLFMAEIITLGALVLSAIFSAVVFSFPDQYQYRRIIYLPVAIFVIFCGVMFLAWRSMAVPNPPIPNGMECLVCITSLSILPALMIFYKIRRMASTNPAYAGACATLAAFAIGALTLRLSEDTNSIPHLVIWHYMPMLAAAAAGIWLGRKIFKW
jgi:hypothetical protein